MEIDLKQLKCGQCGNDRHRLYQRPNGEIISECIKCGSTTEIVISEPEIKLNNLSGLGTLCIFDNN
jgi:uncharacterized Zn finger protein